MPAQETINKSTLKKKESTFSWQAPMRPFKRRDREFYINLFSIASLLGLILFLVDGWMPVVLIISIIFLIYVMSSIEPEVVEYKIGKDGLFVADKKTDWEKVLRFWFSKRYNSELLVVEIIGFPGRLEYVVAPEDKEKIRKAMAVYTEEEETPPSSIDKMTLWFSKKLRV